MVSYLLRAFSDLVVLFVCVFVLLFVLCVLCVSDQWILVSQLSQCDYEHSFLFCLVEGGAVSDKIEYQGSIT